jgi:hypothetical protein
MSLGVTRTHPFRAAVLQFPPSTDGLPRAGQTRWKTYLEYGCPGGERVTGSVRRERLERWDGDSWEEVGPTRVESDCRAIDI